MSRGRCKHPIVIWNVDRTRPYAVTADGLLTPLCVTTKRCLACRACLPLGPAIDDGPTVPPETVEAVAIEIRAAALTAAVVDAPYATFDQAGFTQAEADGWSDDYLSSRLRYASDFCEGVQAGDLARCIYRHDGDA